MKPRIADGWPSHSGHKCGLEPSESLHLIPVGAATHIRARYNLRLCWQNPVGLIN
jgi:hypothetical protein